MLGRTSCESGLPGAKMDSNRIKTLVELMGQGASDAVCLAAADAAPLTYAKLRQLAAYVMSVLNESGIGRENRVAIVMPNGPITTRSVNARISSPLMTSATRDANKIPMLE